MSVLHRYGSVAAALARRLAGYNVGARLKPVGELAAEFGTGRGTIQSALKVLIDEGAVELEPRGKLGSYIRRLDYEKLLARAGLSTVIGVMPVAYSVRFVGLATGLTRAFEQAGLTLVLAQVRGGKNRTNLLRTGRCDFAIVSRLAWEKEAAGGDLHLALSLGPGSYVGDHVLLVRSDTAGITDGMRVGVDPTSHDHVQLALAECQGRAVQIVEISYPQAIAKLLAREIDAAIWDGEVPGTPESLRVLPLSRRRPDGGADTEAVLLVRGDDLALADLLRNRIDAEAVVAVQQRVLSGEEMPNF